MPKLWRYRPADNRTPKLHPIIGGLVWDQVYDNPACEHEPGFVPVEDDTPDSGPDKPADQPADEKSADAGKPGRSK